MSNKRLALNTEGEMTYCSSSEENIGHGRCNHVGHLKENETQMHFMNRMNYNKEIMNGIIEEKGQENWNSLSDKEKHNITEQKINENKDILYNKYKDDMINTFGKFDFDHLNHKQQTDMVERNIISDLNDDKKSSPMLEEILSKETQERLHLGTKEREKSLKEVHDTFVNFKHIEGMDPESTKPLNPKELNTFYYETAGIINSFSFDKDASYKPLMDSEGHLDTTPYKFDHNNKDHVQLVNKYTRSLQGRTDVLKKMLDEKQFNERYTSNVLKTIIPVLDYFNENDAIKVLNNTSLDQESLKEKVRNKTNNLLTFMTGHDSRFDKTSF